MAILWGIICGFLCLLPGWGVGLSALLSVIVPGSGLYAIVVGLILNSIVEARVCNSSSGNIYAGVVGDLEVNSCNEQSLGNSLIIWKTGLWIVGVLGGLLLPPILGGSGLFITCLVFIVLLGTLGDKWWTGIVWVCAVTVLMSICEIAGISDPVTVIGLSLFVIPNIAVTHSVVDSSSVAGNAYPNILTLIWGSILAIAAPGVSPQAISTMVEARAGRMTAYMTTAVIEVLIEGIALGQIFKGGELGKALISSYVIEPNVWVLVSSCALALCVGFIALTLNNSLGNSSLGLYNKSNAKFIASIVGVVGLMVFTGPWAFVFIPLGLAINAFIGSLLPDPSVRGLTFISLLV